MSGEKLMLDVISRSTFWPRRYANNPFDWVASARCTSARSLPDAFTATDTSTTVFAIRVWLVARVVISVAQLAGAVAQGSGCVCAAATVAQEASINTAI